MPRRSDHQYETHDERVSTEAQRKALDEMSDNLVRKLNAMVAEQEARARDFAAHQHSLSSLPQLQQFLPPQLPPQEPQPPTRRAITNGPAPDTTRHHTPAPRPTQHPAWQDLPAAPEEAEEKPERGIGAGTIVFIIFVIIIVLRNCG